MEKRLGICCFTLLSVSRQGAKYGLHVDCSAPKQHRAAHGRLFVNNAGKKYFLANQPTYWPLPIQVKNVKIGLILLYPK